MSSVNKVVLAYSGGLDTSVIVKWLPEEYQCEVVTFTADIGQGEEVEPARAKAQASGGKEIYKESHPPASKRRAFWQKLALFFLVGFWCRFYGLFQPHHN